MFERSQSPWLAGLGAVFVATGFGAVWLMRTAAAMQVQVNNFYNSQTADQQVSEDSSHYWDTISQNAYTLQQFSAPVLVACGMTVIIALAMLARLWDVHAAQADATAAS